MIFGFHHLLWVTLPMMALLGLCTLWLKATYAKYKQIGTRQGVTGAETAMVILRAAGIHDVRVEQVGGFMTDHYSPTEKVLRLSPENYSGTSIAAVGVAAHEVGHAIQDAERYAPLVLRNLAVPVCSIGSSLGWVCLMIGLFMGGLSFNNPLVLIGLTGIAAIALFQVITLPVEFNASRRALRLLPEIGILTEEENHGARAVLTAAAMTYVAATIAALWELAYWILIISGSSRD